MSVVLTFAQPDFSTVEKVKEYLLHRPNYSELGRLIDYDNADTGCGFSVEFNSSPDSVDLEQSGPALGFLLNYNRPKPFIREAIAEISAFNKVFPGPFYNEETSQIEAFEAERFLEGWSRANDYFIRKLSKESNWYQVFAPSAIVEKVWAWNAHRQTLQMEVGDDLFVANVIWLKQDKSAAIPHILWADTVRTLFPDFIDCFALGTPKKVGWRPCNRRAEAETEYRIVPGATTYANATLEPITIRGTRAYATPINIPDSLLRAVRAIAPMQSGADHFVHASFVIEAEILQTA
ncbi:MAG: hypothetical protein U1E16_07720 [Hyphomicrobiales bacterium]